MNPYKDLNAQQVLQVVLELNDLYDDLVLLDVNGVYRKEVFNQMNDAWRVYHTKVSKEWYDESLMA
jgi:hypothetical protein